MPIRTTSNISIGNRLDHLLARWSINRNGHLVEPGLYALGNPGADSPVFVTANYTLSFDALRSALSGIDGYILVLDTKGVNVWCAAGKGTFSTDELVRQIDAAKLAEVVNHRMLIAPQLGAVGIAAHEVKKRTGFKVEYGPIYSADLPEYMKTHTATPIMREVHFNLIDRVILIPVEFMYVLLPMIIVAIGLYFLSGWLMALAAVSAILAGVVLFPILIPIIPTTDFSSKGFILGGVVALPFALILLLNNPSVELWMRAIWALNCLLILPAVTAFLSLNFTGATNFPSRTGVKREMLKYISIMAGMFGIGLLLAIVLSILGE